MNKDEVLRGIRDLAHSRMITEEEVLAAYRASQSPVAGTDHTLTPLRQGFEGQAKSLVISQILYYLGGAIVFLGIAVLIGQNWDIFSTTTQILVTLGSGVAAYVVAVLLGRYPSLDGASHGFYLVSAITLPIGLGVTFDSAGYDVGTFALQTLMSFILFAVYGISFLAFRRGIFALFSVIFGTWLFFSLTSWLVDGRPNFFDDLKFIEYRILLTGLAYLLLGYSVTPTVYRFLTGWLYGFGTLGFLGAALALGGWSPNQNLFWEVIYPGLVFGIIFLSLYVKSRAFLVFGSAFLMGYILKITAEYFEDSLGWPLALVICGLALIGIGYMTLYLNNKYLTAGKRAPM